jgi:hypothetical protein
MSQVHKLNMFVSYELLSEEESITQEVYVIQEY